MSKKERPHIEEKEVRPSRYKFCHVLGCGASAFHFATKQDYKVAIPAVLVTVASSFEGPVLTILLGNIFDSLGDFNTQKAGYGRDQFMNDVTVNAAGIFSLGLASVVLSWAMVTLWCILSDRQASRARTKVYRSLIHKTMNWYDCKPEVMGLLAMANRNVADLKMGTSVCCAFLAQSTMTIIISLVLALYKAWSLALVSLAGIPVVVVIGALTAKPITKNLERQKQSFERASNSLHWTLDSICTVKLFNAQSVHLRHFEHDATTAYKFYIRFCNFMNLQQGLSRVIILAMFAQGFFYGSHLVQTGQASGGVVMAVFWNCITIADSFHGLTPQVGILRKAQAAVKSLLELIQEEDNNVKDSIGIYMGRAQGDISLRNVGFEYPSRPGKVLDRVNMRFKPGETTFLVGKSGSGKSSLSAILLKLYQVSTGTVLIDDMPLEGISSRWLFDNVHVVEQDATLFDMSIWDNICMGRSDTNLVPVHDVEMAAQRGYVDEFAAKLRDGMDTKAGPGGASLSGGQRQRVAIARACVSDAPIMVFDESVSALDIGLRYQVMESIRQFRKGKTTIIITHELSQIRDDDYVYLMHEGHVGECGAKKDLVQTTLYQQLFDEEPTSPAESIVPELLPVPRNNVKSYHTRQSVLRPSSIIGTSSVLLQGANLRDYQQQPEEATSISTARRKTIPKKLKLWKRGKKKDNAEITDPITTILRNIFTTLPNKPLFILGITIAVANGLINPLFSYAFSNLFTGIIPKSPDTFVQPDPSKWATIVLALAAADGLTSYLRIVLDVTAERWIKTLRCRILSRLLEQDVEWGDHPDHHPGALTNTLMNDAESMRLIVTRLFSSIACIIALAACGLTWSFVQGWKLSLVGLSLMPGFYITSRWYTSVCKRWDDVSQKSNDGMIKLMNEVLSSIKTVKILSAEREFLARLREMQRHASAEIELRKAVYVGLGFGVSQIFKYIVEGLLLWYGMKLIASGEYTEQQTMLVFTLLVFSLVTADQVFSTIPQINTGFNAFCRIHRLLNVSGTCTAQETLGNLRLDDGTTPPVIELRQVSFGYGRQEQLYNRASPQRLPPLVLSNISLRIDPGEVVALTGASGCGKSTVAALLTRLYHAESGCIYIHHRPIDTISTAQLRRDVVAVVHQMPVAFLSSGTILDNLRYALHRDTTTPPQLPMRAVLQQCRDVCDQVGLLDFIQSLPEGFDTEIGNGASQGSLSGGQLQRLAIARALLKRPRVLVLDECTSALDVHNMGLIQKLIQNIKLSRSMTVVMITHQQEMISIADRTVDISSNEF